MNKNDKNTYIEKLEVKLTSSMEDYLKAIYFIATKNKNIIRVGKIAKKLNCKMPSVCSALNKLKKLELIEYEKYGFVQLTPKGFEIAKKLIKNFKSLSDFLQKILLLNNSNAEKIACNIEHFLSDDIYSRIHKLLQYYQSEKSSCEECKIKQEKFLFG